MKSYAVIDTSALIWDQADFVANQHNYYGLVTEFSSLLKKLESEKERLSVLLRKELGDEVSLAFPWQALPNSFLEFRFQVISFLSRVGPKLVSFSEVYLDGIESVPVMIKNHFGETTITEVQFLMSKMHRSEVQIAYFTFAYLWNGNQNQTTSHNSVLQEYTTIVCENEMDIYFDSIRPTFEHNRKHDKKPGNDKEGWKKSSTKDQFESRLSCFNGTDTSAPQKLLDKSTQVGGRRYVYDHENETYVIFMAHKDNKFHGYDEYDSNKIPQEVKEIFLVYNY